MTIVVKIELKEDWGNNCPCVVIKTKPLRGEPQVRAILTPAEPVASVPITRDHDLIVEAGNSYTVEHLK